MPELDWSEGSQAEQWYYRIQEASDFSGVVDTIQEIYNAGYNKAMSDMVAARDVHRFLGLPAESVSELSDTVNVNMPKPESRESSLKRLYEGK